MFTKDWLSKWAIYSPDKIAIEEYETGREISYSNLNLNAKKLAAILMKKNLKKGDRVFVVAEQSVELVTLFGAAQKSGIIIVPVNYRLAPAEISELASDCTPELVLYDSQFRDKIEEIDIDKKDCILCMQDFFEQLNLTINFEFKNWEIDDNDPLFILYTSGTTGRPKGVIYTHKMLFWNSINTTISIELTAADHTINCMPAFHTGGWNVLLTPMLHRGATVGIIKKFDAELILKLLHERESTIFMGVPTMLKMMKETSTFNQIQLDKLRYFIVGGEALPHEVIKCWHQKGVSIRQGYGLTEVGPNLTSLHQNDAEKKLGSIGKPNFYLETKLVDKQYNEVKAGEIGEFCLKGKVVTPGYWKNETATAEAFKDGWFKTGDLMKRDEDGYLYVVDRKKSMFISGGENVYPAEVERVLATAGNVKEVAVIGVPDEKWGEVGKAFVVLAEGANEHGLAKFCCDKLAKFKMPKHYKVVDELPKNDSGKIDRKALKQLL
jgi:fatty-acyl-CoA synthase